MKFLMYLIAAAVGYVLGSVSTGIIVSKLYGGIDIRQHGSGNVGMTNVMRTLGWVPSFLTFAGDVLKGVAGALLGRLIAGEVGMHIGGIFAIAGHNWPAAFKFKGGKGMSTSFGYILVADWRIGIFLFALQLAVLAITGYMSLASIISSVAFALAGMLSGNEILGIASVLCCAMAIYSHRENIKRLKRGNENKLDPVKITSISKKMVQKLKDRRNRSK